MPTISIDPRFNGPPDSANGGYTCGLVAQLVGEPTEVTLRSPPPLGRELRVDIEDGSARVLAGEELVAEAERTELELEAPPPVEPERAQRAMESFPFRHQHPFPTCFVCGPDRHENDGLRIFPGPVNGDGLHAAHWTPAPELAGAAGTLPPELVWAALDCPTSVPVAIGAGEPGYKPIVLARLSVRGLARVRTGEPHVIVSWPIAIDGRKRHAGAALYTEAGELLAYSRALWIELRSA